MNADAMTLGELGGKTKKNKVPKLRQISMKKVTRPKLPKFKFNQDTKPFVPYSYDPPPPGTPPTQTFTPTRIGQFKTQPLTRPSGNVWTIEDQIEDERSRQHGSRDPGQPGQGKFSKITDLINRGLDAFAPRPTATTGGNMLYSDEALDPNQQGGDPNTARNAGKQLGGGLGQLFDSITTAVKDNPLLFGALGIGAFLLFKEPPKRGK